MATIVNDDIWSPYIRNQARQKRGVALIPAKGLYSSAVELMFVEDIDSINHAVGKEVPPHSQRFTAGARILVSADTYLEDSQLALPYRREEPLVVRNVSVLELISAILCAQDCEIMFVRNQSERETRQLSNIRLTRIRQAGQPLLQGNYCIRHVAGYSANRAFPCVGISEGLVSLAEAVNSARIAREYYRFALPPLGSK